MKNEEDNEFDRLNKDEESYRAKHFDGNSIPLLDIILFSIIIISFVIICCILLKYFYMKYIKKHKNNFNTQEKIVEISDDINHNKYIELEKKTSIDTLEK